MHCSCGNADGQPSAFSEEWQCGEGNTVGSNEKMLRSHQGKWAGSRPRQRACRCHTSLSIDSAFNQLSHDHCTYYEPQNSNVHSSDLSSDKGLSAKALLASERDSSCLQLFYPHSPGTSEEPNSRRARCVVEFSKANITQMSKGMR